MNPTPPGYPDPHASDPPQGRPADPPPSGGPQYAQQPSGAQYGQQAGGPQYGQQPGGPQYGQQPGGQQYGQQPGGQQYGQQSGGQQYGGQPAGNSAYGAAPQGGFRAPQQPPSGSPQGGPQSGYASSGHPQSGQPPAAGRSRTPRPGLPPLPVLAALTVCALALLNAVFGFLRSAELTRDSGVSVPLGSVYAVAGWIPALLVVSGLTAAATRLKGVSVPTLWAVSAATAVMGGVGGLFYLVSREGADAGLGFALSSGSDSIESGVSAGLVLVVLFGLLQLVAALGGLLLTQSPQLARRASGGTPDAAHRYGPAAGGSADGPQGFPGQPGQPAQPGQPGQPGQPAQSGGRPTSGDAGSWRPQQEPGSSPSAPPAQAERYQDYRQPSGSSPLAGSAQGWTAYAAQPGHDTPVRPSGEPVGYAPAHPAAGGIAPYGQYSQTERFGVEPRENPVGGSATPPAGTPSFYDPQSGRQVRTGLTQTPPSVPPSAPWIPEPAPAQPGEAERATQPDPSPPVEYERTEYGSSDFEWEPTYTEASDGEPDETERDDVVRYENPEQRPQYAPPKLDSARHEGWDAGFAEDTLTGTGQPPAEQSDRYRSIPRAE